MSAHGRQKKRDRAARPSASRCPPRQRPRNLRAGYKRATRPLFVRLFSLLALGALPILLLCPWQLLPAAKTRFRSWYRPCSPGALRRLLARWKADPPSAPSFFQLALFLIDFSPLRPILLRQTMRPSAQGEPPFDPLSLLLACLWKIASGLPWTKVASQLADPDNNALWRRLCGFFDHDAPSEATLRTFRECLPDGLLNYVQKTFLATLDQLGLLPDPAATHGYLLVGDGQRHQARSYHRCHHAVATCYQPAAPHSPRPCPAREQTQGQYGCDCAAPACREACALAPRLDRQARYSVYDRDKEQSADPPAPAEQRTTNGVFGYRSLASRLVDTRFHLAWNVYTDCLPANADEGARFPAHFAATHANLPRKEIGYVIYDAACGEQPAMDAVYDHGGIPLFNINRDPGDKNTARCRERGYDEHGHLLCHLGLAMTYLGLDRSREQPRARWACLHACRKSEQGERPACPYLENRKGQYRELKRAFDDGSYRLARLVPYGSKSWKSLTAWRNTSEGRNSSLEDKGLKRFPDYGLRHGTFLVIAADIVENLCTLARLVYEATLLDERFQALQESLPRQRIVICTSPEASAEQVMGLEVVAIG
jgi:hypothetical protein